MACTAVTRETHLSWRDRENGIGPRVGLTSQETSSHKVGK